MKRYLHSCEDPMAAAHSIVLSRHCTVIKSLYSPRCAEEYCECVSVVKKPWVRTCVFTTGLAIKMAHTKASADNSLALSTQTKYEMHRKTTVWIPATYAQVYNVLCGKSHTAIVHHLHSNFPKQKNLCNVFRHQNWWSKRKLMRSPPLPKDNEQLEKNSALWQKGGSTAKG